MESDQLSSIGKHPMVDYKIQPTTELRDKSVSHATFQLNIYVHYFKHLYSLSQEVSLEDIRVLECPIQENVQTFVCYRFPCKQLSSYIVWAEVKQKLGRLKIPERVVSDIFKQCRSFMDGHTIYQYVGGRTVHFRVDTKHIVTERGYTEDPWTLPLTAGDYTRVLDRMKEEDCPICLERFPGNGPARSLPCKHLFHGDCLSKWLHENKTCPLCRLELQPNTWF